VTGMWKPPTKFYELGRMWVTKTNPTAFLPSGDWSQL